ncbi:acetone carboxylase subunit alpha, partial [Helicobacter pylori NCTC 11637 = CCUG 17874 = ATCC 43504 = JCM 12093]
KNRIKNNASLPLGGDFNPTDRDYEKHISHASQVKRDKQCITTENCFDNYDLYLNYIKGGPGFGDPIERDLNAILEDLNSKQLLPEYAYKVYGAIVSQNKDGIWVGDEAKTKARRKEILENRKARSIPVKEWMEQERNAILEKEASKQVKHMYATSFDLSPKFLNDFKTFWNLPKSWSVKEDELGVFTYGSKYRMDLSKLPDVRTVLLVDEK